MAISNSMTGTGILSPKDLNPRGDIGFGRELIKGPESDWLDGLSNWLSEKGEQFNNMDEGSKYNLISGIASQFDNDRNASDQNLMNAVNARAEAFGGRSMGQYVARPSLTNTIRAGVLSEQKRDTDKKRSKLYDNLLKAYTKSVESKLN